MREDRRVRIWRGAPIPWIIALALCAATAQAETTTQFIQLGDGFAGSIAAAGVDTVRAQFNAAQGTAASISVKALRGGDLQPTIALLDPSGAALDLGGSLSVKGKVAQIKSFPIPASGTYVFEVGGASGSGDFEARTRARVPNRVDLSSLSGFVTNGLTGAGIAGATVAIGPYNVVTDATGAYSEDLPVGDYTVTLAARNFETQTALVTLLARVPSTLDAALTPVAPVLVSASVSGDAVPGASLTARVAVEILDGSALESIAWSQANSVEVVIQDADTDTATVMLPGESAYKHELIAILEEPAITEDQLPPNVELPAEGFSGGLQNRFQIAPVNPLALEEAGHVALDVIVTTSSGAYADAVDIHTHLPFKRALSIRNVPVGVPVILHGRDHVDADEDGFNDETGAPTTYDWFLSAPAGSLASLVDATSQNPHFTPDVSGVYTVEVPDTTRAPGTELVTIQIFAGTWQGAITGQDANGRPLAANCTGCHNDGFAPDKFTPWAQTGHAEIFTNNLNTSTHYGESCFGCHMVGFDPEVANGGADDAADYADFFFSGLLNNPGDNWTAVLDQFPETARMANIQCENCHGPQNSPGHSMGGPRVDLSAETCGFCHGEPLRHARYQQWQLSAHANYGLAVDEGGSGNCSRCHTANGFLTWLPILLDDDPATDPTASITVTWTADETHPQTCATCHDPHAIGTTSGNNTNARVRVSDSTPPLIAGFTAVGVGRGAMCMTCHNSRRGLRNDDTFASHFGTSEAARAPHGSVQADLLMGQNAYFVNVGVRGKHSLVEDSCVNCHMEQTPPPDLLSYNEGGTNHTFFARKEICSNCHGDAFNADGIQAAFDASLDDLKPLVEDALLDLISELLARGDTIDLNGVPIVPPGVPAITGIDFGEFHGQQSITVTLQDGTSVGPVRMNEIEVTGPDSGVLYDFADPRLIKAGWNYNLVHNDGSRGVHNPDFAFRVIDFAIDALQALAAE